MSNKPIWTELCEIAEKVNVTPEMEAKIWEVLYKAGLIKIEKEENNDTKMACDKDRTSCADNND